MTLFIFLSSILIVLLLVFRKQIHEQAARHLYARVIKYVVVLLLIAFALFSIIFAVGEVTVNDVSGLWHLFPLIPIGVAVYLLLKKK